MKPKTIASALIAKETEELKLELESELEEDSEELSIAELRSSGLLKGKNDSSTTQNSRQNL